MSETNRKSLLRKRASRLAAAQALYAKSLNGQETKAAKLISEVLISWEASKANDAHDLPHATQPDKALLTKLVEAALANAEVIEPAIESLILPGWKKSRMSQPLLATLRAFAAESLAFPKKSRGMLVDEYTEIAAQLVTDDELSFAHKGFNLLLDTLRENA